MVMTNKQIATKTPYDLQQENGQKKEKLCWRKLRSTLQIRSKQIKKQKDNTLLQKERAAQTNQITTLQSIKGETLIIYQYPAEKKWAHRPFNSRICIQPFNYRSAYAQNNQTPGNVYQY